MIEYHKDWILVQELEDEGSELSLRAAKLIRELKEDYKIKRDEASRLRFSQQFGEQP